MKDYKGSLIDIGILGEAFEPEKKFEKKQHGHLSYLGDFVVNLIYRHLVLFHRISQGLFYSLFIVGGIVWGIQRTDLFGHLRGELPSRKDIPERQRKGSGRDTATYVGIGLSKSLLLHR